MKYHDVPEGWRHGAILVYHKVGSADAQSVALRIAASEQQD
jgi:hypothetical protein